MKKTCLFLIGVEARKSKVKGSVSDEDFVSVAESERVREKMYKTVRKGTRVVFQSETCKKEPTTMIPSLIHSSPNTVALGIKCLTHELGGHIQTLTIWKKV